MNDVRYYRDLLADDKRIETFRRAIRSVVHEGDRVLEIGAGLGTYSFFASAAGAARVWAVDGNPVIHVAKTVAAANGMDERIEFVRGWIPEVRLPERADVLIFEDYPTNLMDAKTLHLLRSLHDEYTADEFRMIPRRARVFVAPVGEHEAGRNALSFMASEKERRFGIDWSESRVYAANTPCSVQLESDWLAAPPAPIGDLWLDRPPDPAVLDGEASWHFDTGEVLHGIAWWFDLEAAAGEWITNRPGTSRTVWGQLFLPLDPPLRAQAGDEVSAAVGRDRDGDGSPAWFSWRATAGETVIRGHEFASAPASLRDLASLDPQFTPILTEQAALERGILELADGHKSVAEIADRIRQRDSRLSESRALRRVVQTLKGRVRDE
jgi:protein arginine N-methyltransferase 1